MTAQERLPPREQGKLFFQKGKYGAAAEAYSEAINEERDSAPLYQNRALCYQKLERWADAAQDANKAIELASDSVKAFYIRATACLHLNDLDLAEESFRKALQLSQAESAAYRESIERGLYSVLESKQVAKRKQEEEEEAAYVRIIDVMLEEGGNREAVKLGPEESTHNLNTRKIKVHELEERIEKAHQRPSVPEALCCSITFELMRDPVMSPSGTTYERDAIEQHIRQNGAWDPVSRQPLTLTQLRPNLALKEVIQDFLAKNPWAYGS